MHLQKSSQYGLYAVVTMARRPEDWVSAGEIAEEYSVSESHVAKVLQQLARARIVESVRGPSGGYRLVKNARDLTMFDVVNVLEGALAPTCFGCGAKGPEDVTNCAVYSACPIRRVMEEVAGQVHYTLRSVSLANLAR